MLLPSRCPVCATLGPAPCATCAAALLPPPALPTPPGVDRLGVLFAYEGAGRELVARLKYRNARASLAWLARGLAAVAVDRRHAAPDAVTWVPTSPARKRARGFDQAELLARRVARALGVRAEPLLVHAPGPPQTGRSAGERRAGPRLDVHRRARVPPRVLVVDDVVTTGATLRVAARMLREAGAASVTAVAVARTPRRA